MIKMIKSISPEFIQMAARILKTMGHPDRIKIVEFLESGEKTVGQIQREFNLLQPVTSQHLKVMYDRDIFTSIRYSRCALSIASCSVVLYP